MINTVSLAFLLVTLLLVAWIVVMVMQLSARIVQEEDKITYERARREASRRAKPLNDQQLNSLVEVLMHCARNRIGLAVIIEGDRPLGEIEKTGDELGVGKITQDLLHTLAESSVLNRGAILIRHDYIASYNCLMPIERHEQLEGMGVGNRGLGAYGVILRDSQAMVLLVSSETGRISLFGHIGEKLSVDIGLTLQELSFREGVGFEELKLRIQSLLNQKGAIAALESDEYKRLVKIQNETREEKRERIRQEREEKRLKKKEKLEKDRQLREQKRKERQTNKEKGGKLEKQK